MGEGFFLSALVIPPKEGRFTAIGEMNGTITVIFPVLGTEGVSTMSGIDVEDALALAENTEI